MKKNLKNSNLLFKKKGNVIDMIFIVLVIFGLGVAFMYFSQAFGVINTEMQNDADLSTEAKEAVGTVHDSYIVTFDGLIAFLFFGMMISVIITSFFLDSHPVFFVVSLILFVIIIFPTVILANTFEELATDDDISAEASQFNYTVWIMSHIVELLCIMAFVVFVVSYGKNRAGGIGQ